MAGSDLIPNDGEQMSGVFYPPENTTYQAEGVAKKGKVAESYPVLADLIGWFDSQIAQAEKIDNIELTSMTIQGVKIERKVSIEAQVLAYNLLADLLKAKKSDYLNIKAELDDTPKR